MLAALVLDLLAFGKVCTYEENTDYGSSIGLRETKATTREECCAACLTKSGCHVSVWVAENKGCYMKGGFTWRVPNTKGATACTLRASRVDGAEGLPDEKCVVPSSACALSKALHHAGPDIRPEACSMGNLCRFCMIEANSVWNKNRSQRNGLDAESVLSNTLCMNGTAHLARSSHMDLLVLIFSSNTRMGRIRRAAARATWAKWSGSRCRVRFLFVVGGASASDWLDRDVLHLAVEDVYQQLSSKVLAGLRWVQEQHISTSYIAKVDDDTFLCVGRLLRTLSKLPRSGLYAGALRHGDKVQMSNPDGRWFNPQHSALFKSTRYAPFMVGGAYFFSLDVAYTFMAEARRYRLLQLLSAAPNLMPNNEDTLFGDLLFRAAKLHGTETVNLTYRDGTPATDIVYADFNMRRPWPLQVQSFEDKSSEQAVLYGYDQLQFCHFCSLPRIIAIHPAVHSWWFRLCTCIASQCNSQSNQCTSL